MTGSTRGLGNAYARALAEAGAKVVLNGTKPETLDAAVAELKADGIDADGISFDVGDEAAVIAGFEKLDRRGIVIDIVVNNAGIQHRQPMLELSTADWKRVVDVHLTGTFVVAREAVKRLMAKGRGGKIINIGFADLRTGARHRGALYGGQGRDQDADQGDDRRMGGATASRPTPSAHGFILTEMTQALADDAQIRRLGSKAAFRRAAGACPRIWRARWCSWPRPRPTTSTAMCSMSTAAGCPVM